MRAILLLFWSLSFGVVAIETIPIPLSSQERSELALWSELARNSIMRHLYLCEACFGHFVTYNVSINDKGEILQIKLIESSGLKELEHHGELAIRQAQPFQVNFLSERTLFKLRSINLTIAPKNQ